MAEKYLKVVDGLYSNANGYEYRENEINICVNWNPTADNGKDFGGFNYTKEEYILRWLHRGNILYDVEIPENAEVIVVASATPVYRTNKIIIKNPREIDDEMALHFYEISNLTEEAYLQALAVVSVRNYKNTAYKILEEKVNKDNIDKAIDEWNKFIYHKGKKDRENVNQLVNDIFQKLNEIKNI